MLGLCRGHVGSMLGPCWLYVGHCWAAMLGLCCARVGSIIELLKHVGPQWAYVEFVEPMVRHFGHCWAYVGPILGLCCMLNSS